MHSRGYCRLALLMGLATTSMWLVSCGGSSTPTGPGPRKELVKVTGKVTVNGQPGFGVNVTAVPQGLAAGTVPFVGNAVSDEGGNYEFTTYEPKDGLPPGDYVLKIKFPKITMSRQGDAGIPDQFKGKYADDKKNKENAKLKFTVPAGAPFAVPPIDLEAEIAAEPEAKK